MKKTMTAPRTLILLLFTILGACGDASDTRPYPFDRDGAPTKRDPFAQLQARAIKHNNSQFFYWGGDPSIYAGFDSHSNRLVPVYVRGPIALDDYTGTNSVYRDAGGLRELYGYLPENTLNENAVYLDQTNVFDLQKDALDAGVEHIFLVVFDGMDYNLLRLGMLAQTGEWLQRGSGSVFSFQTVKFDFGFAVTSPYGETPFLNIDQQTISAVAPAGGYNAERGGATPWDRGMALYLSGERGHLVTDSSASATAMTTGEKTWNGSVNVGPDGKPLTTIAHLAQRKGYAVGVVSSVPFNHATPAAAYAHNVSRGDYQDLARDMLGLPSVAHPDAALPGLDVVLGAGALVARSIAAQGANFEAGNPYLAAGDLQTIRAANGGRYIVVTRRDGAPGAETLEVAARQAIARDARLFGLFGTRYAHLPYRTANGDYQPVQGAGDIEHYSQADLIENPTLAQMTDAAIDVLASKENGFWLMVEAGDVDWAAHANNIDNAVGAIYSGDQAVREIIEWVNQNSNWRESALIVTADHGHLLYVNDPQALSDMIQHKSNDPSGS